MSITFRGITDPEPDYHADSIVNIQHFCATAWQSGSLRIQVDTAEIKKVEGRFESIPCKIELKTPDMPPWTVGGYVACGHWSKLGDLSGPSINLVDHFSKLLPPKGGSEDDQIGLVTIQNGIQKTFPAFREIVDSLIEKLREAPLVIGLHNATKCVKAGIIHDAWRFSNEEFFNHKSVYSLLLLLKIVLNQVFNTNPHVKWAHFAHSEGGLIAHTALDVFNTYSHSPTLRMRVKNNLIIATYGAVSPVPDEHILLAKNTYSDRDVVLATKKKYFDKDLDKIKERPYISTKKIKENTYTVQLVQSVLFNEPNTSFTPQSLSIEDHGFLEPTYQKQLKKDLEELKGDYGFYNAQSSS